MSLRIDATEWISGSLLIGNTGLGVTAETIPSTGDSGASYLFNDVTLPADNGKEICGRITSWPSAGTLRPYEDGSFEFSGAPDGAYSFGYQLYVDGVAIGSPVTVSLTVGPINGSGSGATAVITITPPSASGIGTASGVGQGASVPVSLAVPMASAVGSTGAVTLTPADISAIAAAVLAALNGTTIPVNAVTGAWPTANDTWSHPFVSKLLTVAKFLGLK